MFPVTVTASASAESSNVKVEVPTVEAAVSSEPKNSSTDDSNVWTKPLPVTEEKSRFAFHP